MAQNKACGLRNHRTPVLALSSDANSMAENLKKKGFDCKSPPPALERGIRCRGKVEGYPEAVNIYIPSQFEKKREQAVALHLHGHNLVGGPEYHFNLANGNGDYGRFLAESGSNRLLIIPESQGKDDTYKAYFNSSKDLDRLMRSVQATTETQTWSKVAISSHSGSDVVVERFAKWYEDGEPGETLAKIQGVALFDSLYADRSALAKWPASARGKNSNLRFYGSYVVGPNASTADHMKWLRKQVGDCPECSFREVKTEHMAIMKDGGMSDFLRDGE